MRLAVDAIGAPPVAGTYAIGTAIAGLSRLFLQPAGARTPDAFFG